MSGWSGGQGWREVTRTGTALIAPNYVTPATDPPQPCRRRRRRWRVAAAVVAASELPPLTRGANPLPNRRRRAVAAMPSQPSLGSVAVMLLALNEGVDCNAREGTSGLIASAS